MMLAIEGVDRRAYPELFDNMFRMRAAVFADRLGWDVTVVDGREVDRFDDEDPLYLLCVNELTYELKGAVRLLPTTGPNMLRDVFATLVPDGAVESPRIWELALCHQPQSVGRARSAGRQSGGEHYHP